MINRVISNSILECVIRSKKKVIEKMYIAERERADIAKHK